MISVENLTVRFGERLVLDQVSLTVQKGEILALMGSSGGGKTTLLRAIAGLVSPESGEITVCGTNVRNEPDLARNKMGMVFQHAALFDYLTVQENIAFGVRRKKGYSEPQIKEICRSLMDTVGLSGSEDLMPAQLSGGMKKRVGIARALAMQPQAMMYDEPVTGLDPVTSYIIDGLIVEVRNKFAVTSLVVSHDVTSVFRVADRVAFLDGGHLVFQGSVEDFRSSKIKAIQEVLEKSSAEDFL